MIVLKCQTDRIRCLAYSPDGETLATGGNGSKVRVWEPSTGRQVGAFGSQSRYINAMAYSPDGRTLAVGGKDGVPRFWDGTSPRIPEDQLRHRFPAITSLAFAPDGARLVSTAGTGSGMGAEAFLWDIASLRPIARLRLADSAFWCVEFSPDGKTLSLATAFSHDGVAVVLGPFGPKMLLWSLETAPPDTRYFPGQAVPDCLRAIHGLPESPMPPAPYNPRIYAAAFAPGGRALAAALGPIATLRDLASGRRVATFKGHRNYIRSLAFSADGETLATASFDRTVRLWDTANGAQRACLAPGIGKLDCVAFSPDGMTLAAGGEGDVVVWDLAGDL